MGYGAYSGRDRLFGCDAKAVLVPLVWASTLVVWADDAGAEGSSMSTAKRNAAKKRRLIRKADRKARRAKEVRRLRHLGWPSKCGHPVDEAEEGSSDDQ